MTNLPVAVSPASVLRADRNGAVRRSQLAFALVIGILVSLLGFVASPANAVGGGSISGTVTGEVNAGTIPLAGINVEAVSNFGVVTNATTDASGNYTFSDIAAGTYTLSFVTPFGSFYLDELWNNKLPTETADVVTVVAGVPVTGLATTLTLGGWISGNVKGLANVNLESVSVSAYTVAGAFVTGFATDASGNYLVDDLAPGDYKLLFSPPLGANYLTEWWNNKSSLALADAVTVTAGVDIVGRDAILAVGGTITGNVKNEASANIEGVSVFAVDSNGAYFYPTSDTDASGNYTITALPSGSYTLNFDAADVNYVSEWWDNKPTEFDADYFPVVTGSTVSARDAVLAVGATISGNVEGGSPAVGIAGVLVSAFGGGVPNSPTWVANTQTDAAGNYTIKGLPAEVYTLYFRPQDGDNYVPEYWDGQFSPETADLISVSAAATVIGKNASLLTGSTISGTLTDTLGAPISGIALIWEATGSTASYTNFVGSASVAGNGQYSITGLPIGSYRVGFTNNLVNSLTDDGGLAASNPYVSEWWNNSYTFSTATTVGLGAAGQVASNVNGTLANPRFADVSDPSSTFYPFIEWMGSSGISTGTAQPSGKPLYKPVDAVSRQAMALFMYRLSAEIFVPPVTSTFADVPTSSQFYTAVEWMASRSISTGTAQPSGKPLFKPSDPVSRQAMALFVARYAGADLSVAPVTQRFADVPLAASTAAAIDWMFVNGISTGTAQPTGLPLYKPTDPVTRQAMAAFLFRVDALP